MINHLEATTIMEKFIDEFLNDNGKLSNMKEKKEQLFALKQTVNDAALCLSVDGAVAAEDLHNACRVLDQLSYKSAVEERALSSVCGYPLCSTSTGEIPAQNYIIRKNRLYDITCRKHYCSNECFECSLYLLNQLPCEPLWLVPDRIPSVIKLLSRTDVKGIPGEEVFPSDIQSAVKSLSLHADDNKEIKCSNIAAVDSDSSGNESETSDFGDEYMYKDSPVISNPSTRMTRWSATTAASRTTTQQNERHQTLALNEIRERHFVRKGSALCPKKSLIPIIEPKPIAQCSQLTASQLADESSHQVITDECTSSAIEKIRSWFAEDAVEFLSGVDDSVVTSGTSSAISSHCPSQLRKVASFLYGTPFAESANAHDPEVFVPVVDSQQQSTYRQHLLVKQLSPAIRNLAALLNVNFAVLSTDFVYLLQRLHLTSENVYLKPQECYMASCIILLLLLKRQVVSVDIEDKETISRLTRFGNSQGFSYSEKRLTGAQQKGFHRPNQRPVLSS